MKKIAIAFGVLVAAIAVVTIVALRNLNSYLEDNRAWIESQAQSALGRPVSIGGLRASVGWGVSAEVSDLSIADDPAFSKESFLRAGKAQARVKLLPLLSGRVEVGRVVIRKPDIRVIQTKRGMNIDSLGAGESPAAEADAKSVDEEPDTAGAASIAIALFRIKDGDLLYRDTSAQPTSEIVLGGFDVDFKSDGNLEDFRGRLEVDASTVRMRSGEDEDDQWEPIRLRADLDRDGDVLHVRDATLRAADLRLDLEAEIQQLSTTPSVEVSFSSPGGRFSEVPFEGLKGALRYADSRASIESLALQVFGGEVDARGVYNMKNPGRPSFELDLSIKGVRVEQAIASQSESSAEMFEGEVATELSVAGAGADWNAMRPGLNGGGEIHLLDGVLRKVNLAESALGGLSAVPGLSDLLGSGLREKYPALFGGEETRFDQAEALVTIGNGAVQVEKMVLSARDFAVEGAGRIGLDGALDLPTRLLCSEALGLDLIERQSKLEALRGASGRVEFPLRLRGTLPAIRPEPDIAAVAAAVGKDRVRDLLGKALGRSQGTEEAPSEAEAPAAGDESGDPEDAGKELLKKGIDSLFGR